jgi:hypothetical protein
MVEGTKNDGTKVLVPITTPEETVPRVRTQPGVIYSAAEQARLAGQLPEGVPVAPQSGPAADLPSTPAPRSVPKGQPARGGAASTPTPNRG